MQIHIIWIIIYILFNWWYLLISRSWQFEPKKLYDQNKGVLESKFDNLVDNINRFNYKIDRERIESKKQHVELINELRSEIALSKLYFNRFMDEMKKERIQSNQQHKEILDILNKTLNNKK